ncbi:MAG: hypothetical protein FWG44_05770 [Oscillospiraceae bacterium]|nr:hypothetical protein [Oscillospiraceae bacterium]
MSKPIDFVEKYTELGLKIGDLFGYPVDDAAIYAYGITDKEIEPYMKPEYRGVSCSVILDKILADRAAKNKT